MQQQRYFNQHVGYAQPGFFHAGYPQPGFTEPVTMPPMAGGWMAEPEGMSNGPAGLSYLTQIDQLHVEQQVEAFEAFIGFEFSNKYAVKNKTGQLVYFILEETDALTRNFYGSCRPFDVKIMDSTGNEVIHLKRPMRCTCCCWPCCQLQTMEVSSPRGSVIGFVEQNWGICFPNFSVKNAAGEIMLHIKGPLCTVKCCQDVDFPIYSANKARNMGQIRKEWSGCVKESMSDADNFVINFPMELDKNMKATLIGACILVDFMFFEQSANQQQRHH